MYIESEKDIGTVLNNLKNTLEYKSWKSLPKFTEGKVSGNYISLKVAGIIYWAGRGEFNGEVKSINGKTVIEGKLNSLLLATVLPLVLILLFPLMWADNDAMIKLFGLSILFSFFGNWLVRKDHSKIISVLEKVMKE